MHTSMYKITTGIYCIIIPIYPIPSGNHKFVFYAYELYIYMCVCIYIHIYAYNLNLYYITVKKYWKNRNKKCFKILMPRSQTQLTDSESLGVTGGIGNFFRLFRLLLKL